MPRGKVQPFGAISLSRQRSNVGTKPRVVSVLGKVDDDVDEEEKLEEEKLREPPSSWHHAARLKVLHRSSTTLQRILWFSSSLILVLVQMCVMLSFLSALSARRCIVSSDCDAGAHCAGLESHPRANDPLDLSKRIHRGVCLGCGTRYPDDLHIDRLLEVMCPGGADLHPANNQSTGIFCMGSCMNTCTGTAFNLYGEDAVAASAGPRRGRAVQGEGGIHLADYSPADKACAAECTSTCAATLHGEMASKFALAAHADVSSGHGVPQTYETWLAIGTQCLRCPSSVRQGVRYATLPEVENLRILKMSFVDFVALGLALLIVALTMMREVRDMNIGQMMTLQALQRDAERVQNGESRETFELDDSSDYWRWGLGLQAFLRRYFILPDCAVVVVLMISRFGGDTVSIMLNTLAALFMLELDNLAFDYGLTAGLKSKIEGAFIVELGPTQSKLLQWSRRWHVITLTIFLLGVTTTLVFLPTLWLRLRVLSFGVTAIIALGEVIELALRFGKRTRVANVARISMLFVKVTAAFLFKWWVVSVLAFLPDSSAPLDP